MARLSVIPEPCYEAIQRVRETALERFDSLFTPERRIWTEANLRAFEELFVKRFDGGEGDFLSKLQRQLTGSNDDVIQLAAELLFVQQLFTTVTGPSKKIENVRTVLGWGDRAVTVPEWASAGAQGFSHDQSFNQHRPFHVAWLTGYLLHWHALDTNRRATLLKDPWAFKADAYAYQAAVQKYQPMREALLYMVFPDHFESISARRDKQAIRNAFRDQVPGGVTDNIDADILALRKALASEHGDDFHFYRSPLHQVWKTEKPQSSKRKPKLGDAQGNNTTANPSRAGQEDPAEGLMALGESLFLEPTDALVAWVSLLLEKGQMILQGPPGTGKTFLARRFANALTGDASNVSLVQFHPSYAYEDFVEGFRPAGPSHFEVRDGPLKRIAARAAANPNVRFVLIIDEINRGNIAKVFGELLFLLEYRDEEITLQYSDRPFRLPRNLFIIGTMNTADRSIALLDMALRRRFRFVDLVPDEPPIKGLLHRFLEANAPDMAFLASMLDHVNTAIGDRHAAIGPSHFLSSNPSALTDAWARSVWAHSVLPALADRFFDNPGAMKDYRYDTVRDRSAPDEGASPDNADEEDDDDATATRAH
jgi:hypothetical protein